MTWFFVAMTWMLAAGKAAAQTPTEHPWVLPLAYVASIVFVVVILAGAYLIHLALRQRQREDSA